MAKPVIPVRYSWTGPDLDVFQVVRSDMLDVEYEAEPLDDTSDVMGLFAELEGAPVIGFEIVDFLSFHSWDEIPVLGACIQFPDEPPLKAIEALKRIQVRLADQFAKHAPATRSAN